MTCYLKKHKFLAGRCYSLGSFDTKVGTLRKQSRINFVQKQMSPASRDFCQNIAEEDSIKEHMGKYRDIFCTIPEFKNLDVKSDIKDIRKVNNTNLSTNYNTALQS
jgi:hypothetical protein